LAGKRADRPSPSGYSTVYLKDGRGIA